MTRSLRPHQRLAFAEEHRIAPRHGFAQMSAVVDASFAAASNRAGDFGSDVLESQKTSVRAPHFETDRFEQPRKPAALPFGVDSQRMLQSASAIESKTVFYSCRSHAAVGYQAVMKKRVGA